MTINEKKQLNKYIKGLVREALADIPKHPDGVYSTEGNKEFWDLKREYDRPGVDPDEREPYAYHESEPGKWHKMDTDKAEKESGEQAPDAKYYETPFGDLDDTENLWRSESGYEDKDDDDEENIAGLNELRRLAESYARESLREMDSMPRFWNDSYGLGTDDDESFEEDGHYNDEIEEPVVDGPKPDDEAELDADPIEDDDEGLYELRQLAESYARESVSRLMIEKKKGGWKKKSKKNAKKDKSKKKISSSEKTIMDRLNNDAVNAAHYYYKLYGVENGTEDEKAAARSLGYKKAKGKKLPGKNGNYRFSSKERNKLYTMMTTDNN